MTSLVENIYTAVLLFAIFPPPDPTAKSARRRHSSRGAPRASGMRLELVGLDGATVYLPSEQIGATVGALRRWEAARAGLPSPSLLRLKSGGRNLSSDEAPLADVRASVHALLRLPGGTNNKYFFSGRMEEARQKPNGGNVMQAFVHPSDPAGPHMEDVLPVVNSVDHHGNPLFNLNPMLIETVRLSDFFWKLAEYSTFAQIVEQAHDDLTLALALTRTLTLTRTRTLTLARWLHRH